MEPDWKRHVLEASSRADVCQAVENLYGQVQREIDARRPLCVISGRCCRFEEYGHRLFVTTMELASFVRELKASTVDRQQRMADWDGTGCPFQVNKLCTVHAFRPFGCRMFFCDATSTQWQNEQYERFHAELKELHKRLDVPYVYVEWREALRELVGSSVR